ncbi:YidB family protein (plasmid) [Streptomycetaceae bacterium NBC_01309]
MPIKVVSPLMEQFFHENPFRAWEMVNPPGGLPEAMRPIVDSWIGEGPNTAITPEQAEPVFSGLINDILNRTDLHPSSAARLVAQDLPAYVDFATPDGYVPTPID